MTDTKMFEKQIDFDELITSFIQYERCQYPELTDKMNLLEFVYLDPRRLSLKKGEEYFKKIVFYMIQEYNKLTLQSNIKYSFNKEKVSLGDIIKLVERKKFPEYKILSSIADMYHTESDYKIPIPPELILYIGDLLFYQYCSNKKNIISLIVQILYNSRYIRESYLREIEENEIFWEPEIDYEEDTIWLSEYKSLLKNI